MSDSDNNSNNVTPKAKRTRRKFSSDEERQEARKEQKKAYNKKWFKTEKGKNAVKKYQEANKEEVLKKQREAHRRLYHARKQKFNEMLNDRTISRGKPPIV